MTTETRGLLRECCQIMFGSFLTDSDQDDGAHMCLYCERAIPIETWTTAEHEPDCIIKRIQAHISAPERGAVIEECARVCDELAAPHDEDARMSAYSNGYYTAASNAAETIRALAPKPAGQDAGAAPVNAAGQIKDLGTIEFADGMDDIPAAPTAEGAMTRESIAGVLKECLLADEGMSEGFPAVAVYTWLLKPLCKAALRSLDGGVRVPVEPTDLMIVAGFEAYSATDHGSIKGGLVALYKAMLAAAPKVKP